MKPRLLDLFCGAGGAAEGYHRAGFEVIGVDIAPQPRYPFDFWQRDALEVLRHRVGDEFEMGCFAAIHASPPCQAFTNAQRLQGNEHPDLIGPTRNLLQLIRLPYIVENVPGAPLHHPVSLTGDMFPSLKTQRERLFECNWSLSAPAVIYEAKKHAKMGRPPKNDEWMHVVGNFSGAEQGRRAMGIHWMTRDELSEAVPPAYTEYIGWELRDYFRKCAEYDRAINA